MAPGAAGLETRLETNTKKKAGPLTLAAATMLGLGYAPAASGTAGTAGAIPLWLLVRLAPWQVYVLLTALLVAVSFQVSQAVADELGRDDPGIVVIDEAAGFLVAMFMVPATWQYILAGFVLFRFFDILKPWPASYFDKKVKNGFGITMDDVVAGGYACALIHLFRLFRG